MGNCITQPTRSEDDQRDRGVPRRGFLQRCCGCVRGRRRAVVGVAGSSSAERHAPSTVDGQTAAIQSLPGVSVEETPLVKPVTFGKHRVGPCKSSSCDRNTPDKKEELSRLDTVASLFTAVSSLDASSTKDNKKEAEVNHGETIADHLAVDTENLELQTTATEKIDTPVMVTASSLVGTTEAPLRTRDTNRLPSGSFLPDIYGTNGFKNTKAAERPAAARQSTSRDERVPSMRHLNYPTLPGMDPPPRKVESASFTISRHSGQIESNESNIDLIQKESKETKTVNKETRTTNLVGEEEINRVVQGKSGMSTAVHTTPISKRTGLPNDCIRTHASERSVHTTERTQTACLSADNISKKKQQMRKKDKHILLTINPPDIVKFGNDMRASAQPLTIVFDRGKSPCSPAEQDVSLTVKSSLELIKENTDRKTCDFTLCVRSPEIAKHRKVNVTATRKEIKNGSARRMILQSKCVTKDNRVQGPIALEKKKSKRHIGRPSILACDEEDDCHRWIQKEGRSADVRISPVPPLYESKGVKKNARERMGLEKLQKLDITIQCKAIERIKCAENEFPGILPELLRTRWRKKMNEQKSTTIN